MLKENIMLFTFFIAAVAFVISMNIQGYYIMKLQSTLKKKHEKLNKKLVLIDFGSSLFIPHPIRLMKYIWSEKNYGNDIYPLIKKVRQFQILGLIAFVLAILSPFLTEVAL